jgi:hypothetical protein
LRKSPSILLIEFPLIEELKILRTLQINGILPIQVVPVTSPLIQPVDIFHVKDFGRHLMVRAANMKLTVDKKNLTVVNISGGGCPDVPYLARQMVGKSLVMEIIRQIPRALEEVLQPP